MSGDVPMLLVSGIITRSTRFNAGCCVWGFTMQKSLEYINW